MISKNLPISGEVSSVHHKGQLYYIVMLLLLRTAVVVMGLASAVAGLRGSGLRLNPVTGGYEDISVVVGEELPASSCPQILDNIKV
jgi:hypothetical protein